MRIAFDSQIFQEQRHGGISRYFVKLAQGLCQLGENVRIFAPNHKNEYLGSAAPELVVKSSVMQTLHRLPYKMRKHLTDVDAWPMKLQMSIWKPDVVHETYYQSRRVVCGRVPLVLTVYDMIHELFPDEFSPSDTASFRKRQAIERADHIICISKNTLKDLIEIYDVDPSKTSFIHLGVDVTMPQAAPAASCAEKPFLLYVGQRRGYKNFDALLLSYANSTDLRINLDLVAFGGGNFSQFELDMIDSLGLKNSVRQVSGNDRILQNYYHSAETFVFPSLYEGFGMPPLEAMAAGCPVASSNTSSMPEVIGDAGAYFDPSDHGSIITALHNVCFDGELRSRLKEKGLERAREFSWRNCALSTLDVYKKFDSTTSSV